MPDVSKPYLASLSDDGLRVLSLLKQSCDELGKALKAEVFDRGRSFRGGRVQGGARRDRRHGRQLLRWGGAGCARR